MKLNPDCIRAVLLYLEENLKLKFYDEKCSFLEISIKTLKDELTNQNISKEDIWYSVYQLAECSYIEGDLLKYMNRARLSDVYVSNITYAGHQFLESIKEDTVWEKTKNIASKVGNHTLKFIETTAQMVAVESAKQAVTVLMTKPRV